MAFKNKRGANIKIGKIRPNTYNEYSGCTVDIHVFVYNDAETRRCKFWLLDYNTSWSGNDLLDGVYEAELENNEEFDEDMELSDVYSDEELEKMVWDAIMAEWEFYPEDCPFLDYINRIEDALSNMAQEDFKDDGDVSDPDIDALLVRRDGDCWDTLDETDLIDFEAMEEDGIVDIVEDCWGEKDYSSLVDDFEKEDHKSIKVEIIRDKLDAALERAITYCESHDTNCLALPYAICKAMCDTHFVLPWRVLGTTRRMILNADWESDSADAALLGIRAFLLTELKKSRWIDIENPHYKRYEYCDELLERPTRVLHSLTELLEKLCHVRPHDRDVSFEFTTDTSGDIRQLKEEYNIVMPHKILYDFLVDAKLKDEYSKQTFHVESYYGSEGYDKSRLTFIRDEIFEQINDRTEGEVIKDVFDADILLKEYEGETFVQQILDAESDDDFYEETEDGFFTSMGIRYFCTDHEYTYTGRDWVAENPGFCHVEPDNIEYSGKVHIPSHVMYHGKPYPVTHISSNTFADCNHVTEIVIDNGVKRIGCDFCDCQSLHSITIPASVTELKKDCFKECDALQMINVAEDNPRYSFVDGILYEKLDNSEKVELYRIKKRQIVKS